MFNFIYSILKRCSLNFDNSLDGKNFRRLILIFVLFNIMGPILYLMMTFEEEIENANSIIKTSIYISIGLIILYPFFRIIHPGYIYLEKVKNYDTDTAYLYLMLLLAPVTLCYIILNV